MNNIDIKQYKVNILKFLSDRKMCIDDLKTYTMEDYYDIAKSIYIIIWGDYLSNQYAIPDLIDYTSFDAGDNKYGGETINTFSNFFGNKAKIENIFGKNLTKYEEVIINLFEQKYQTIGNFMVLPKGKRQDKKTEVLNNIKNRLDKDLADTFFYYLFETDDLIDLRGKERNKFYFKEIKNPEIFCEKNFLEPFFEPVTFKVKKNFFNRNLEPKDFAIDYIQKAIFVIDYRAERICAILKERLKS